jgi:hypothetical protein
MGGHLSKRRRSGAKTKSKKVGRRQRSRQRVRARRGSAWPARRGANLSEATSTFAIGGTWPKGPQTFVLRQTPRECVGIGLLDTLGSCLVRTSLAVSLELASRTRLELGLDGLVRQAKVISSRRLSSLASQWINYGYQLRPVGQKGASHPRLGVVWPGIFGWCFAAKSNMVPSES